MRASNLLILPMFLLAGCGATVPVVKIETQRVEIPVPVPCKEEYPSKPDFNFDKLTEDQDIHEKAKALLADRQLHLGYETELVAKLKACK